MSYECPYGICLDPYIPMWPRPLKLLPFCNTLPFPVIIDYTVTCCLGVATFTFIFEGLFDATRGTWCVDPAEAALVAMLVLTLSCYIDVF